MRIIICEDAKEDQTLLISHCHHFQRERQIQLETIVYQNAGQMLADETAIHADAMFLDIYMEGTTGVKAAKIMRSKGYAGAIVFATNSMQHYAEGYEVEAIHYLIKPVTYPAFAEAMRRILALYKAAVRMITVNYGCLLYTSKLIVVTISYRRDIYGLKGRINFFHTLQNFQIHRGNHTLLLKFIFL